MDPLKIEQSLKLERQYIISEKLTILYLLVTDSSVIRGLVSDVPNPREIAGYEQTHCFFQTCSS